MNNIAYAKLDFGLKPDKNKLLLIFSHVMLHLPPNSLFYLLATADPDGNRTILSRALLDADFGPVGRNQHPARLRERRLN